MPDWNTVVAKPTHITPEGRLGPQTRVKAMNIGAGTASNTWQTANSAVYIPICIPYPYPVERVFWCNGASGNGTGHVDFGIYTVGGGKIYSTGSVLMSGASAIQYVTPATPFILSPGHYYFAYANDGTTTRVGGHSMTTIANAQAAGLLYQTSALPLPNTATFASPIAALILPYCGVTRTTTGF